MPRVLIRFALAAMLSGCASVSSGIAPAGPPDTFTVTERDSPINGGATAARQDATAEARAFCRARGAEAVTVAEQNLGWAIEADIVGPTGVTLTFRCNQPGPPPGAGIESLPPPPP